MLRLTIPSIEEDDVRAVAEVLQGGGSVQDARVEAFQERLAPYLGGRYVLFEDLSYAFQPNMVLLPNGATSRRSGVTPILREKGIETAVGSTYVRATARP